jgi:deoxyadenosine/deoxycytidine kinase
LELRYHYIVVEGNIGAGKTTLASKLAADTGSRLILEQFSDNPFLAKFYENPDRYAFQLELSFLSERYQQVKAEMGHPDLFTRGVVSDYYLAKSLIFSKHNLKSDELKLFQMLFSIINLQVPKPDLYVYLHLPAERLMENIRQRNRSFERNIKIEYLKEVQEGYFGFFKSQTDLRIAVIETTRLDFANNNRDYLKLKEHILTEDFKPGMNMLIL